MEYSENPYEVLMGLKKRDSFIEYKEKFELLPTSMHFTDEEFMTKAFRNGMKDEIKENMRIIGSRNLHIVMEMAQNIEGNIGSVRWTPGTKH